MSEPIAIPLHALVGLRQLWAAKQTAEREYNIALNSTVATLGHDPRDANEVNLDAGILTPAVTKEGE